MSLGICQGLGASGGGPSGPLVRCCWTVGWGRFFGLFFFLDRLDSMSHGSQVFFRKNQT